MEKITAIAIDDEQHNIDVLTQLLTTYCSSLITLEGSATSVDEGVKLINNVQPQLLFLDVVLKDRTSFDVLEQIKPYNYKVVFITAHDKYAIKAIKHNALDYVLKPITVEDLMIAVNKAFDDINGDNFTNSMQIEEVSKTLIDHSQTIDLLAIPSLNTVDFFKIEDIIYCRSEGRYTTFFMKSGKTIMASKNIGEYEDTLEDRFFRIHNRYIVNLFHVVNISKSDGNYCLMSNGDTIPIAKRRQEQLFRFMKLK